MTVTPDDITHLAHLARIKTSVEQRQHYAEKLSEIMTMIEKINDVDTDAVKPMSHPQDQVLRLREDTITETNNRDKFQQIAPQTQDGLYLVPKVIE